MNEQERRKTYEASRQFRSGSEGTKRPRHSLFSLRPLRDFEVTDWEGVKHHWHDEVEILYFMKGEFQLDVNMETYKIQEECF